MIFRKHSPDNSHCPVSHFVSPLEKWSEFWIGKFGKNNQASWLDSPLLFPPRYGGWLLKSFLFLCSSMYMSHALCGSLQSGGAFNWQMSLPISGHSWQAHVTPTINHYLHPNPHWPSLGCRQERDACFRRWTAHLQGPQKEEIMK